MLIVAHEDYFQINWRMGEMRVALSAAKSHGNDQ